MEEKKLTDEEVVKALYCLKGQYISYIDDDDDKCKLLFVDDILNLIYRLQENNGNQVRMRCNMQRKFDDLQNLCIEQKAEIERLKEMCSKSSYKDSWKNKFFKAQEEIERLTEENKELEKTVNDMSWIIKIHKYCVGANHCQNRSDGEFDLQKQVDKLINESEAYDLGYALGLKHGSKDTAKEIFEKLLGYIGSQQQFCIVDEEHKTLIDCDKLFDFVGNLAQKGVEVE